MADATFVQGNDVNILDHTPASDVAVGEIVVLGEQCYVAKRAIAASALGALNDSGIYDVTKGTGALGTNVDVEWNNSNNQAYAFDSTTSNKYLGRTTESGATAAGTIRIRFNAPGVGPQGVAGPTGPTGPSGS